jgi:hypothetical protein
MNLTIIESPGKNKKNIMNLEFTRDVEEDLDRIVQAKPDTRPSRVCITN